MFWRRLFFMFVVGADNMQFGNKKIDLSVPQVMGILNVTPDSFSDGGRYLSMDAALAQVEKMVADGATFIDVGGESTRPGAQTVSAQEEVDRVCPVVEAIHREFDVVISVDTSTPEVMAESVRRGAALLNDVRSLRRPGALQVAVETGVPVCLMHMQGEPDTMQQDPHYDDVVAEVRGFLAAQVASCTAAGIAPHNIILDPGFGFGKTLEHNLRLFRYLEHICALGFPVLVGVSRKTMLGAVTGRPVAERAVASAAAAAMAVMKGAVIVRAHDVRENVDAIKMAAAIQGV